MKEHSPLERHRRAEISTEVGTLPRPILIWNAIQFLRMRERSVFLLRFVEDLQLGEIEQRTGLKVGAVKVYLARAVEKIREN